MPTRSLQPQRVQPRLVGRYELLVRLAAGGMATVHLARARGVAGFERLFAVKLCHEHLLDDPTFVAMFLDEARLAALIRHPNVVATVDVGTERELYLVMEYVEGGALNRLMRTARQTPRKKLPLGLVLRAALDALSGLHAAHEVCSADGKPLHLVHRDLSPHNLLVGVDGLTRVTDFGIARAEARLHQTTGVSLKGKVAYMSPEQLQGGAVDRRSDLFSFGVVLWQLLTGRSLFVGQTPGEIAQAVTRGPIPAPSMVDPELPRALDAVVQRALERDPDRRPATALELADALEASGLPPASHREVGEQVKELLAEDLQRIKEALAAEPREAPVVKIGGRGSQRRLLWIASGLSTAALVAVTLALWPGGERRRITRAPALEAGAAGPPATSQPVVAAPAAVPDDAGIRDAVPRVPKKRRHRRRAPRNKVRPRRLRKKHETYQPDRI